MSQKCKNAISSNFDVSDLRELYDLCSWLSVTNGDSGDAW